MFVRRRKRQQVPAQESLEAANNSLEEATQARADQERLRDRERKGVISDLNRLARDNNIAMRIAQNLGGR